MGRVSRLVATLSAGRITQVTDVRLQSGRHQARLPEATVRAWGPINETTTLKFRHECQGIDIRLSGNSICMVSCTNFLQPVTGGRPTGGPVPLTPNLLPGACLLPWRMSEVCYRDHRKVLSERSQTVGPPIRLFDSLDRDVETLWHYVDISVPPGE